MIIKKLFNRIYPVVIALALGVPVSAQHQLPPVSNMHAHMQEAFKERFTMRSGQMAPIPLSRIAEKKPTATRARLLSMYTEKSDGTQYTGWGDSTRFYWSGTRGGDFDYGKLWLSSMHPLLFDEERVHSELEYSIQIFKTMNVDSVNFYQWDMTTMSVTTFNRKLFCALNPF